MLKKHAQEFTESIAGELQKINDHQDKKWCDQAQEQSHFEVVLSEKKCSSLFQVVAFVCNG